MLDRSSAIVLGVNTLGPVSVHVTGTSGASTPYHQAPAVRMTFAELVNPIQAPVLFGPIVVPMLGRSALMAIGEPEFGFDGVTWKHA